MRLSVLIIILGVIAIIPNGIWISAGVFLIWLFYKLKDLQGIQIEIINQKKQNEYDSEILEEMK